MARELPNPADGTAGQIPKVHSNGYYELATDETGSGGSGNSDITYVSPTDDWVSIVESASSGDIIWFLKGEHKDTHHSDSDVGPVVLNTNGVTLHVSAGATVMARDGLNEEERFIQVQADDITIQGNGVIDGNQANSDGLGGVESGQIGHEHIIDANDNVTDIYNLTITGVTIENAGGGDCIYLNGAHDTVISNVVMRNGYRNAISIIDVDGLLMSNFITEDTQGVSPRSGVAFEPNGAGQEMKDIVLMNFITRNNGEMGLYVNTHWYGSYGTLADITISNGHAISNGQIVTNEVATDKSPHYGVGFFFGNADYTHGIHLSNCTARDSWRSGFEAGGAEWIRFDNCRAISNGRMGSSQYASGFVLSDGWQTAAPCNAVMSGCSAYDDAGEQEHPVFVGNSADARIIDMQIGSHASGSDGIRIDSGTLEHHLIDVRSGDPDVIQNGGTVNPI